MEINSIDRANALTEYQKVEKIQYIEKKMDRLSFTPFLSCVGLMLYGFWSIWANFTAWTHLNVVIIAIFIGNVGYSNMQRTDLLKQLFELKYGK